MDPGFQSLTFAGFNGSQQHPSEANSTWESAAPWYLSTQKWLVLQAQVLKAAGITSHLEAPNIFVEFQQAPP